MRKMIYISLGALLFLFIAGCTGLEQQMQNLTNTSDIITRINDTSDVNDTTQVNDTQGTTDENETTGTPDENDTIRENETTGGEAVDDITEEEIIADDTMSFFITSENPGRGADLGGLIGADEYCQELAESVGAGDKTWRAYLSTTGDNETNARDRIGDGPWYNFNGVKIAENLTDLHSDNNKITKETALSERGEMINGRGDTPNRHDILTGSDMQGRAILSANDTTCDNWQSSSEGSAMVGHHDRIGLYDDEPSRSWVSSHASQGCSQEGLQSTGGDGLFYCFATD